MSEELESRTSATSALAGLVEEVTQRLENGEQVDLAQYANNDPDQLSELRRIMPALEAMVIVGRSPQHTPSVQSDRENWPTPGLGLLGDFELLREIGRGGMGVVYEARQISLQRPVALKILPFAAVLDKRQMQRFKNEAMVAATLEHPHIVSVFSVGVERGVHYYAMQLIEGQSLSELIGELRNERRHEVEAFDKTQMSRRSGVALSDTENSFQAYASTVRSGDASQYYRWVAAVGIQAGEALAYSHEHGVLHRDIKPGNLLLDSQGELFVADFGLARIGTTPELTMTGDLLGTLRYMSPEQALGEKAEVGVRSDIYSLGATLYELATLRPMFAGIERNNLMQSIAGEEPARPRAICPEIPRDLETIILKAIAKEADRRFASAGELVEELQRFRDRRPIKSRPPSIIDHAAKWSRRHQPLVAVLMVALSLICLMLVASTVLINRARSRASDAFTASESNARRLGNLLYSTDMQLAFSEWDAGRFDQARRILDRQRPEPGQRDRRGIEWRLLHAVAKAPQHTELLGHAGAIHGVAVFPDGRRIATVGADATVRIWDVPTCQQLSSIATGAEGLHALAISPDGHQLAVANTKLYLIDVFSQNVRMLLERERNIESLAFNVAGDRIAVGVRYQKVDVVNLVGDLLASVPSKARHYTMQFVPSQRVLLAPGRVEPRVGVISVYNDELLTLEKTVRSNDQGSNSRNYTMVAVSPDGKLVAAGDEYDGSISLHLMKTGELVARMVRPGSRMTNLTFSPSGGSIAASYQSGDAKIWNLTSLREDRYRVDTKPQVINAHDGDATAVQFLDDDVLITSGADGSIRAWQLKDQKHVLAIGPRDETADFVKFSPDGQQLVTAFNNCVTVVDSESGQIRYTKTSVGADFSGASWSPSGDFVAITDFDADKVELVDLRLGEVAKVLDHGDELKETSFSSDGSRLLSIGGRSFRIWDVKAGLPVEERVLSDSGYAARFSHDGKRIAYGGHLDRIVLRDSRDSGNYRELPCFLTQCLAFSGDDQLLASGHGDGKIRVWNTRDGKLRTELSGHDREVAKVSFSSDGSVLASASPDGTIRLWSVEMNRPIGVFQRQARALGVDFSPCGKKLAAAFGEPIGRPGALAWPIDDPLDLDGH